MRPVDDLMRAAMIPLVLGLAALAALPAIGAIQVLVEAESFVDSHDTGGASIQAVNCTSASDGLAVDGLDLIGEWIEIKATVPDEACYELHLGFQAMYQDPVVAGVTIFDEGHSTVEGVTEFQFIGAGLG